MQSDTQSLAPYRITESCGATMKLRHVVIGATPVSAHGVVGFTHDALYAATADLVVEPKRLTELEKASPTCAQLLWIERLHKAGKLMLQTEGSYHEK